MFEDGLQGGAATVTSCATKRHLSPPVDNTKRKKKKKRGAASATSSANEGGPSSSLTSSALPTPSGNGRSVLIDTLMQKQRSNVGLNRAECKQLIETMKKIPVPVYVTHGKPGNNGPYKVYKTTGATEGKMTYHIWIEDDTRKCISLTMIQRSDRTTKKKEPNSARRSTVKVLTKSEAAAANESRRQ